MSDSATTSRASRETAYREAIARVLLLIEDEPDWIAAMATVACELHHSFDHYDWTGFYRADEQGNLVIGPYQGGHGCLRIRNGRGVCGAAAATLQTQLVPDVEEFPGHISCSDSTRSEIVVPVLRLNGKILAVLDADSDTPDAFGEEDRAALEELCQELSVRYGGE